MKKIVNTQAQSITFEFDEGLDVITFDAASVSEAVALQAKLHGFAQKLGDAAAIARSEANGYKVTESMRREAVEEMAAQLLAGNWNKPREAGVAAESGLLLSAMRRKFPNTPEATLRARLEGFSKEQTAQAKIALADIIAEIKRERAGQVDESALFGDLM